MNFMRSGNTSLIVDILTSSRSCAGESRLHSAPAPGLPFLDFNLPTPPRGSGAVHYRGGLASRHATTSFRMKRRWRGEAWIGTGNRPWAIRRLIVEAETPAILAARIQSISSTERDFLAAIMTSVKRRPARNGHCARPRPVALRLWSRLRSGQRDTRGRTILSFCELEEQRDGS